jgi:hypothetical protein
MQVDAVVASLPSGSASACESPAPPTWKLSFPETTAAPSCRSQTPPPCSKPPSGASTYIE